MLLLITLALVAAIYGIYVLAALLRAKDAVEWLRKVNDSGSKLLTSEIDPEKLPKRAKQFFDNVEREASELGFSKICVYKSLNLEAALGCHAYNAIFTNDDGVAALGASYYICKRVLLAPYLTVPWPHLTGTVKKNRAFETEMIEGQILNTHDLSDDLSHIGLPFILNQVPESESIAQMLESHLELIESSFEDGHHDCVSIHTKEDYFEYHTRAQEVMERASKVQVEEIIERILEPLGDSSIRNYVDPGAR